MDSKRRLRNGRVSATDAAKNLGALVNRVREERSAYVIERGGVPVAVISPIDAPACTLADLKAFCAAARRRDDEYARALEDVVGRHHRPRARKNPWAR